ncbi:MAG: DUF4215 domain-containing protein, partial [Myxococcota bacterium]
MRVRTVVLEVIVALACAGALVGGHSAMTQSAATCGDGIVAETEECDDGGTVAGDGCNAQCLIEGPLGSEQSKCVN